MLILWHQILGIEIATLNKKDALSFKSEGIRKEALRIMMRKNKADISINNLRELRLKRHLTQAQLAEKIGTTNDNVSRWERGIIQPSLYFREQLCELFQVNDHELLLTKDSSEANQVQQRSETALYDPQIPNSQHIVGRTTLIADLVTRLCSPERSHAIFGLPGIGKTTLAVALAHHPQIRQHFHDGILWMGLGQKPRLFASMSRWGALHNLTSSEMEKLTTLDDWARCLHDRIGNRKFLLIIDDVWDISDAVHFRLGGPQCAHLVTTRFPAIAFPFALSNVTHLQEFQPQESQELLHHLISIPKQGYTEAIEELIKTVGGLPLAISLMGRYLYTQASYGTQRRFQTAFQNLSQSAQVRMQLSECTIPWENNTSLELGSIRSLYTAIEMSINHLSPQAQQALQTLALFLAKPLSFSEDAAITIASIDTPILDQLLDSGLLEPLQSNRYCLHQTITDYMRLRYKVDLNAEKRFVTYYVDYTERYSQHDNVLEPEHDIILTALNIARERSWLQLFRRGILAFIPFLEARCLSSQSHNLLTQLQIIAHEMRNYECETQAWLYLGNIANSHGNFPLAEHAYMQGIAIAKEQKLHQLLTRLLLQLAHIMDYKFEFAQAQTYLQAVLQGLQPTSDNPHLLCSIFKQLGENADDRGESSIANQYYAHGLQMAYQAQAWDVISAILNNQGIKAARRGEYQKAEELYQEALMYAQKYQNISLQCGLFMNLGMLAFHRNDIERAISTTMKSLQLARKMDYKIRLSAILQNLGIFERAREQFEQAEIYLIESIQVAKETGHRWTINEALTEWGRLLVKYKRFDEAREIFEQVLTEAQSANAQILVALSLFGLAQVEAANFNLTKADKLAHESLEMCRELEYAIWSHEISQWLTTLAAQIDMCKQKSRSNCTYH